MSYDKMTKAELIEALGHSDRAIHDLAKALEAKSEVRPGWWIGVVLFAAIVTPWLLVGMWVLS